MGAFGRNGVCSGVPPSSVRRSLPYPDTILLFKSRSRRCETAEELEEQIEITVVHEVAHLSA
jgi:predicted Zn-dependent protease with MMP-like domain